MEINILKEIGLTDAEAAVYLALIEVGPSTTGPIVDKAQIASSKVYLLLEKLMQKGLVSFFVEKGVKKYEAAPAQRILDYVKEKKKYLEEQQRAVQRLIPVLEAKQKEHKRKTDAVVYKGMKGLETAFQDVYKEVKKNETVYNFVVGDIDERLNNFFIKEYAQRKKQNIKTKTIFSEAGRNAYNQRDRKTFDAKIIPELSSSPATTTVYGNKVILRMGSATDIVALMINNKNLAEAFLQQFTALWNQNVFVFEGKATTNFFTNILEDLKAGEEYYVINGNYGDKKEFQVFFQDYHKKRSVKGIKANLLFNQNIKGYQQSLALPPAECKFLPADFKSPLQMTFYKDKLYISLWQKRAIGVLIQNEGIVGAFKAYFTQLWQQKTQTMYGEVGVKAACDAIIEENKDFYIIGANGMIMKKHAHLLRELEKKREKTNIQRYHLAIEKTRGQSINTLPGTSVRYLPEHFESPNVIWIFGNKVAHVLWERDIVILIDDSKIAEDYRNYFDLLWKTAKV